MRSIGILLTILLLLVSLPLMSKKPINEGKRWYFQKDKPIKIEVIHSGDENQLGIQLYWAVKDCFKNSPEFKYDFTSDDRAILELITLDITITSKYEELRTAYSYVLYDHWDYRLFDHNMSYAGADVINESAKDILHSITDTCEKVRKNYQEAMKKYGIEKE